MKVTPQTPVDLMRMRLKIEILLKKMMDLPTHKYKRALCTCVILKRERKDNERSKKKRIGRRTSIRRDLINASERRGV